MEESAAAITKLKFKIDKYRQNHGGKSPAKIFVSREAFSALFRLNSATSTPCLFLHGLKCEGISLVVFHGSGQDEIYLSDEEE